MASKTPAVFLAVVALTGALLGRTPASQTPQKSNQPEEVVRIGVTLVQVDAVVTDKTGHLISDLKPDDFIVRVDGRPQTITNFSYISTESDRAPAPRAPAARDAARAGTIDSAPIPIRSAPLSRDQVRRTFALVVDDLTMSFESICYVREALKKFVDQQMASGDLAAIIRTSGGIGLLQQFTSDKELLRTAIDRIQWSPVGMGRLTSIDPVSAQARLPVAGDSVTGAAPHTRSSFQAEFAAFRQQVYSVGTLGTLDYIIRGLKPLPGRKSLVLFSDGFRMFYDQAHDDSFVIDPLRKLVDLANRSSVVIYTIDSRGLPTLGYSAADRVGSGSLIQDRIEGVRDYFDSVQGLSFLSQGTGGLSLASNDLSLATERAVEDQGGYYLIGFVPDEGVFRPVNGHVAFHNISVVSSRPGLHVRSRKGFLGATDESLDSASKSPIEKLVAALASPFGADDISLHTTSLFWHSAKEGSFLYTLLHIDPAHLTFTDEPDHKHQAAFDVLQMIFGDNGRLIGRSLMTKTLTVSDPGYRYIMDHGLVFAATVGMKGSGAVQCRVAVQDRTSGKVGTASSFVTIPDLGKHRLALSGIFLRPLLASGADVSETSGDGEVPGLRDSAPALRKFTPGTNLDVSFVAYNARLDQSKQANLEIVVRLVKNGKVTYTGPVTPFHPAAPAVSRDKRASDSGIGAEATFRLGDQLEPGSYAFQVICRDNLAKPKQALASQWIDFEVTKDAPHP